MRCPNCGFHNAFTSHYCRHCGSALNPTVPESVNASPVSAAWSMSVQPAGTGFPDDDAALQELLVTEPIKSAGTPDDVQPPLAAGAAVGSYTVTELREEHDDARVYRATAPADVCQQCGTRVAEQPDPGYCHECGAELKPRNVLLIEYTGSASPDRGPGLVAGLPDDPARALLPPVEPIEQDGRRLLVVEESVPGWQSLAVLLTGHSETPDEPAALEDTDALPIALQLARLLQYLHQNNVALGNLSLAQLLIGPQNSVRLRDIEELHPLDDQRRAADLQQLHQTVEELTRMPRETRKLDAEAVEGGATPRTLQEVLAQARTGGLPDAGAWVAALEAIDELQRAVRGLRAEVGAASHVGMVRELNEDSLLTIDLKLDIAGRAINGGLYVVSDGMGGHAAGEVASSLAVQSMANVVNQSLLELSVDSTGGVNDQQLAGLAQRAVEQANRAVYEESRRRGNDMGCTLTFGLALGDRCIVGNIGDSRTYLLHNGELNRVSKDHSLVQRLVDMGQIQPDEMYTHPHRNAIMRSLGEKQQVELDLYPLRLEPGDILFCCSDGQWEMVRDPRMAEMIVAANDMQAVAEQLVAEGNQNGGDDNITAVLVRFT